jgi:hypothetical protein
MRKNYPFLTGLLAFIGFPLFSQTTVGFSRVDTIPVYANSSQLTFPWAGGLNFCQFSDIDLNMDGKMDLFVFDRTGNKITTFLNTGTPNQVAYVLAPQYVSKFPRMHDWVLLRDYNCDGKMDIFTYSIAGFSIYKNTSTLAGGLSFQLVQYLVNTDRSPNSSHFVGNLFVSQVDIPAIRDMDGDGDLDILTFQNGGNQVEYHRNMSMELYGVCDSIRYQVATNCWGEFTENANNSSIALNTNCPGVPRLGNNDSTGYSVQHHSGSCLECINTDNDNDQDVILGDISNPQIVYLKNGGTNTSAMITAVDDSFPFYDLYLNQDVFTCAFHVDVNNDGKKDLLFSPQASNSSENFTSCSYYRNTNTNSNVQVTFVQNNFLQDNMIEVGEGCYPVFYDYDGDGDKDLFIGNFGYYHHAGPYQSEISLYKNMGNATTPSYALMTRDFANLHASNPSLYGMAPTFGDLDGDGDLDMLCGDNAGRLNYFQKLPGPADNFVLTATYYQSIDVGDNAAPQLIDVDRDGLLDLLIGKQTGTLSYYHNTGSATNPIFTLVTTFFGGVRVNQPAYYTAYSTPCLYDDNGTYILLVGSERGWLNRYDNIDGNLAGTFTRTDSMYVSTYEGGNLSESVTDLNNDGYFDIVIGNYSGGVSFFYGDVNVSTGQAYQQQFSSFNLYPNPANETFVLRTEKEFPGKQLFAIHDLSGKEIYHQEISSQQTSISVADFPQGVYICTLTDSHGYTVYNKLVISR